MITRYGKYLCLLEKLAATAFKEHMPALSDDAQNELVAKGIQKPKASLMQGWKKGTDAIAADNRYYVDRNPTSLEDIYWTRLSGGGSVTKNYGVLLNGKEIDRLYGPGNMELVGRHEAYEAGATEKARWATQVPQPRAEFVSKGAVHMLPEVLAKDIRDINRLPRSYHTTLSSQRLGNWEAYQ